MFLVKVLLIWSTHCKSYFIMVWGPESLVPTFSFLHFENTPNLQKNSERIRYPGPHPRNRIGTDFFAQATPTPHTPTHLDKHISTKTSRQRHFQKDISKKHLEKHISKKRFDKESLKKGKREGALPLLSRSPPFCLLSLSKRFLEMCFSRCFFEMSF